MPISSTFLISCVSLSHLLILFSVGFIMLFKLSIECLILTIMFFLEIPSIFKKKPARPKKKVSCLLLMFSNSSLTYFNHFKKHLKILFLIIPISEFFEISWCVFFVVSSSCCYIFSCVWSFWNVSAYSVRPVSVT